jgi:hypothetical protein
LAQRWLGVAVLKRDLQICGEGGFAKHSLPANYELLIATSSNNSGIVWDWIKTQEETRPMRALKRTLLSFEFVEHYLLHAIARAQ